MCFTDYCRPIISSEYANSNKQTSEDSTEWPLYIELSIKTDMIGILDDLPES